MRKKPAGSLADALPPALNAEQRESLLADVEAAIDFYSRHDRPFQLTKDERKEIATRYADVANLARELCEDLMADSDAWGSVEFAICVRLIEAGASKEFAQTYSQSWLIDLDVAAAALARSAAVYRAKRGQRPNQPIYRLIQGVARAWKKQGLRSSPARDSRFVKFCLALTDRINHQITPKVVEAALIVGTPNKGLKTRSIGG